MFNWLFGKKKSVELPAVVETTIVNEEITETVIPVYEETPKEKSNIDILFEVFPDLKELCDRQLEATKNFYRSIEVQSLKDTHKLSDVKYYGQLRDLPEIDKVMSDGCYHDNGNLYSYLSDDGKYVTIHKSHYTSRDPDLYISVNIINPPVLRVVENLINDVSSWDIAVIIEDHKGCSNIMSFTEACFQSLRSGGLGYPHSVSHVRKVKKYLHRRRIRVSLFEETLKVNSDEINLAKGEVRLLEEVISDYEWQLVKEARLKFEEEETQKRAAMDEVVAELLKGE